MSVKINIPLEVLRQRKLFLAVPMYGGINHGMFARSCMDLAAMCAQHGIVMQVYFLFNESLITRARNYCADEFVRSPSTHMMFIDSDIGFDPRDVLAMLAMMGDDSPYDVLTGPYPKKCISWEKIKMAVDKGLAEDNPNDLERYVGDYVFNPKMGAGNIPIEEPVEVLDAGTGFMMIRKNTFKRFAEAFPKYLYTPDHARTEHFDGSRQITQFFQAEKDSRDFEGEYKAALQKIADIGAGSQDAYEIATEALAIKENRSQRYLSEDYWFTQKVQQLGMKVWMCPWMKLTHAGTYIFGGSLRDMATLGTSPTADPALLKATRKGR
jgi:hypothetical protein